MTSGAEVAARVARDHRHLDDLLGRCLAALDSGDLSAAKEMVHRFDEELRRHTAAEEEHFLARGPSGKLVPAPEESEEDRLRRELSLEHVQVRELSGMLLRVLSEKSDVAGARALLPGLLRRWDAHTSREESALASLTSPQVT